MTTEKTPTELPEPRARTRLGLFKQSPRHFKLACCATGIGSSSVDWIHFYDQLPLAVQSSGIVYFCTPRTAAETRLINSIAPDDAHIRQDANAFDFIVGQVLCKAGLPLTQAAKP